MATSSNRDVTMTLSVETLGQDDINTLQAAVASLAKEGGDAAPEFQQLADEIARIGDQAQAIAAFKDLATQTDALATKQQEAATKVGELAAKLQLAEEATKQASTEQKAAANALLGAQQAYDAATTGIKNLNAAYDAAGRKTEDYRTKLKELTAAQGEQRDKFAELRSELKQSNAALSEAEGAQNKLTTQHARADAALVKVTTALRTHNTAIDESAQSAEKLGTSTENLATSEATLLQALNDSRTAALARAAASKEMEESDRLLAIQAKGMADLYERGRVALLAEEAGLREAARASINYKAAREAEENARIAAAESWQKEAFAIVEAAEAAQKLKREVDVLAAAERELANIKAFSQQAEDAQKLQQAGEYVKFWESELSKVEEQLNATTAATKETSTAAEKSAQSIANAFRAVGVKSAQELETEIVQVRLAMDELKNKAGLTGSTLSTAFAAGEAKINGLERQMREVNGTLTMGDKAAKLFSNSLGQISAGNIIADGVGYLVNKVKELGQAFVGAIVQGDQLQRGLNAVYKDADITAKQIDFLRKASSESGVAFGALSGEFVKFTASMKMSNIPMEQSNALFKAVTAASSSLGLSADSTAGTLNALGQMASKGTVSLEELRAQLGDRLPGALGLTAQGLGITEAQLIKLVESGGLATRDFIVPFTKALGDLKVEADGLVPTWERLKGAMSETAQNAGDSGWTAVMTAGLKVLGGAVSLVVLPLTALSELIFGITKSGAILAGSVLTWTQPWSALGQVWDDAARRQGDLTARFDAVIDGGNKAAQSASAGALALSANTAEVVKSINANAGLGAEQKLVALATALAADATLDAAAKIVQYNVSAAELIKSQQGQTEAFEKLAKAAKEQGATLVENAKLTGDNTAVQAAALEASKLYAEAVDKATASQQAETAMLVAQKAELLASAEARKLSAQDIKVETEALDAKITASKAETEQSVQAQAAANIELRLRQLASAALDDNSSRIDAYRNAVEKSKVAVEKLKDAESLGFDVTSKMASAQSLLTTATVMYRDGVNDLISKINLETKEKSANLQLSLAQATASQNHYTAMAAEARVSGDIKLAVELESKARNENIRALKLKLELDKLQQAADLLIIENKRKLYDADTVDGQQKLKLLDIEMQIAKIKALGNQEIIDKIALLEKQAKATDLSTLAHKESVKTMTDVNTALGEMNRASQGLTGTLSAETQAKVNNAAASVEDAKARYEEAKASGDEKGAAKALIAVKEEELKQAEILAQAKREEAAAARQVAKAKEEEAKAAAETAKAIEAEIAASDVVTESMKKQAAEANVNAIAKAGAAKEAYAHANSLDAEADAATRSIESAKRGLDAAKGAMNDLASATDDVSGAVQSLGAEIDEMGTDWSKLGYYQRISQAEILETWKKHRAVALPYLSELISKLNESGDSAKDLADAVDVARSGMYGLKNEDLMPLRNAISDAQQRMKDLGDEAQNTINSIQDELDGLNGNYDDIEKRRYEARRIELESKRDESKAEGNLTAEQGYTTALGKLKELYDIKIADANNREKENNQKKIDEKNNDFKKNANNSTIETKGNKSSNTAKDTGSNAKIYTVNVNLGGTNTAINTSSDEDAQALISLLQRAKLSA